MNSMDPQMAQPAGAAPLAFATAMDGGAATRAHSIVSEYLSIARRRKWLIIGAIALFFVVGVIVTLLMTPLYTASATLEIQRETRNVADVQGAEQQANPTDVEFYQTQYGLLQARSLAERVAASLRLQDDPGFFAKLRVKPALGWFDNGRPVQSPAARQARLRAAGSILLDHFKVDPERMSRLVDISFVSPDPQLSKRVVDAWSEGFIQSTLDRRYSANSYARRFLEDRLQQLRVRIDQSERALVGYASSQNIVSIPGASGTPGQADGAADRPLVADDLSNLNRELSQATADRVQAESRVLNSGGNVRESLDNSTVNGLRTRRAELASDYARMLQQFDPAYPPAKALQAQIAALDQSLQAETGRVDAVLNETYRAAAKREAVLQGEVTTLTGRVLDYRRRNIQYNILQREADTNRQLYDALLQKYKQIGVAGGVGVNNIAVVDAAEEPVIPSSPRLFRNLLIALAAGTIAGLAAALLVEQIDQGIADPVELEQKLGLPLIGVTPKLVGETPVDALQDPKAALTEAYASIVATLGFATAHGVPKTLAITSARPAEGKSSTSYAIARSLARTGRRVLLVDADMRSPSMHHLFGIPLGEGLSNYLAGQDDLTGLVLRTEIDNLSLMTTGPRPPSTPELLSGGRLEWLIVTMTRDYDHLVFDLPPVMGLADAPLIASQVEGTLMVIAAHVTFQNVARVAIDRLRASRSHILGVVLSMFDPKQAHYGYGHTYGYGYGYEYGSDGKKG